MTKKQILIMTALLLTTTIAVILFLQKNKGIKVETSIVQRGDIVSFISAPGNVRPITEIKISSDVGGRVINPNCPLGRVWLRKPY